MWVHILILFTLGIIGCKRETPRTMPATVPAEQTNSPATTQASAGVIYIDERRYEFPPILAVVQTRDEQRIVQLMTDDPPEAALEGYTGNVLFLSMSIDAPEGEEQRSARTMQWDFHAPNTERVETIEGIVLHGGQKVLQPYEVTATVTDEGSYVAVALRGTFLMFDEESLQSMGQKVAVMTDLVAPVRSLRARRAEMPATTQAPP